MGLLDLLAADAVHSNYVSPRTNKELLQAELERLHEAGCASHWKSLKDARQELGCIVVSKIAATTEDREYGSLKIRLVVDMLRSLDNELVRLKERSTLPRCPRVV